MDSLSCVFRRRAYSLNHANGEKSERPKGERYRWVIASLLSAFSWRIISSTLWLFSFAEIHVIKWERQFFIRFGNAPQWHNSAMMSLLCFTQKSTTDLIVNGLIRSDIWRNSITIIQWVMLVFPINQIQSKQYKSKPNGIKVDHANA